MSPLCSTKPSQRWPIPVKFNIAVENVTFAGAMLQRVSGEVRADADAWDVEVLDFRAPGATQVRLSGRLSVGAKGIAVPLDVQGGDRYVAHVLPMTTGERRSAGDKHAAVAAVFVHKAALETPTAIEVIATKADAANPTDSARFTARPEDPRFTVSSFIA